MAHAVRDGENVVCHALLWKTPAGKELILMPTMAQGVTAYDPATGKVVWNAFTKDLPDRCVSSPVVAGDMVLVSCGAANNGLHLIGAKLGRRRPAAHRSLSTQAKHPQHPDARGRWRHGLLVVRPRHGDAASIHKLARHTGGSAWAATSTARRCTWAIGSSASRSRAKSSSWRPTRSTSCSAARSLASAVTATPAIADGRLLIRTEQSLICLGGKSQGNER